MKIKKSELREIIREEIQQLDMMNEFGGAAAGAAAAAASRTGGSRNKKQPYRGRRIIRYGDPKNKKDKKSELQ